MPKTWSSSDEALLKRLREQSGYDRASFAQRNTLSAKQLAELEDGGSGRFYTPEIKAHTGRTLLRKLGYVAPPEEPAAPEVPAPAAPVPEARREPVVEEPRPRPAAPAVTPAPQAAHVVLPEPTAAAPAAPRAGLLRPVMLLAGVAVVGAGLFVLLGPGTAGRPFSPQATQQRVEVVTPTPAPEVPANPAAAPASAPQETVAAAPSDTSAPVPAGAPATAALVPAVAASPAPAPVAVAPAPVAQGRVACDPAARDRATQYRSPSATRPGTYVYVQSVKGGSLCVIDSQNKQTLTALKAGEAVTVSGVPPFLIHTAQWNDLRVFFQGLRVNLDTVPPPESVVLNVF